MVRGGAVAPTVGAVGIELDAQAVSNVESNRAEQPLAIRRFTAM